MIEAAVALESVAEDLRHMTRLEILDPMERVNSNGRAARRLDEIAMLIREAVASNLRKTNPPTTCPRERRRVVSAGKGRRVVVESRDRSGDPMRP